MSVFERYLTLWVFLCIVIGVALGQVMPAPFHWLGSLEIAKVNLPVGLLIWVMIIPMLLRIDFGALHEVKKHWRGIGVTLLVNWAVNPFSMALLGWIFIRHLFARYLPEAQIDSYIAGLILLLGLTTAALASDKAFLWDGANWSQISADGKAGYIFGIGNLADFENAASGGKAACVSKAFADELKTKTVAQIVTEVDKFYKDNPDKLQTSVIEVVLRRCTTVCPPEIKGGGKK